MRAKRAAFVVALLVAAASGVAAQERPPGDDFNPQIQQTPDARSYVLLLDEDGRPLAAWYAIGYTTILHFPADAALALEPGPNQLIMIDRALLPTRMVATPTFTSRGFDYATVPEFGPMAAPQPIAVTAYTLTPTQPAERTEERSYTIEFRWLDEETRELATGPVVARRYTATNLAVVKNYGLVTEPGTVTRVYLPHLFVDLDEATWARTARIMAGGGMAGSPELALLARFDRSSANGQACFEALAGDPAWHTYLAEFARLEARSEDLLADGMTDVIAYGLADYTALEERTGIRQKFQRCMFMP